MKTRIEKCSGATYNKAFVVDVSAGYLDIFSDAGPYSGARLYPLYSTHTQVDDGMDAVAVEHSVRHLRSCIPQEVRPMFSEKPGTRTVAL